MFRLLARSKREENTSAGPSPAQLKLAAIISNRQRARVRYERDKDYRSFEPYVLFKSPAGELLVRGLQLSDPAQPFIQPKLNTFKVAGIRAVTGTDIHFEKPANFSSQTAEFRYGVINAVDRM